MPQVPYRAFPTVQPTESGPRGFSVQAPVAAFGGAVAHAVEGLGGQLEKSGSELFQRAIAIQQLQNETEAKEADAKYMMGVGKLHADYSALQGRDAVDAYPKYMENIQKLRQDMRKNLSNDMARKMFDSSSLSTMGRTIFNGAGHAATQNKQWAINSAKAQMDLDAKTVGDNPDDERLYQDKVSRVRENARQLAALHGAEENGPIAKDLELNSVSKVRRQQIIGLSRTAPFRAKELFDKYGNELTEDDRVRVESTVTTQLHTTGARMISQEINRDLYKDPALGLPEKGLDDRVKEGTAKAEKMFPNDKLFSAFVADRIRADYNSRKRDIHDTEEHNRLTVASAINGDLGTKVPTTVEELQAISPAVAQAWQDLPATKRSTVIRALAQNAKGDVGETEQNYRQFLKLKGMASSENDDERIEFLNKDIVNEQLPRKWRTELLKSQERIKAGGLTDPRVNRGMRILLDAGIAPRRDTDKDAYNLFRGGLQDALDVFKEQHKREPNLAETKEIGSRLIQEQADPTKFNFGIFNRTTPLYQLDVPNETIEKIKSDPRWKDSGITPSDEQIRREFLRLKYIELYGSKPTTKPGRPVEVPMSR